MKYEIVEGYKPSLDILSTERAILDIKQYFQQQLAAKLKLQRVSAPRFVQKGTGVNDDLSGTERKASFQALKIPDKTFELVFSLAKWKRAALKDYGISTGQGIYTDMDAVRPDEDELDAIHSIYVDQWDWEKAITQSQRTIDYLKSTVRQIYSSIRETEQMVSQRYGLKPFLPSEIAFVHASDLQQQYPDKTPKQREYETAKQHKAVFLIGIGASLSDGKPHDVRAPDYDDWITPGEGQKPGLNGDILVWHPVLEREFEISSMGIRVDKDSLIKQLELSSSQERIKLPWHKRLLSGHLPLSIGGGIGQSRLCMFLLKKAHIGEVQASVWPKEVIDECREKSVPLL